MGDCRSLLELFFRLGVELTNSGFVPLPNMTFSFVLLADK